MRVLVDASGVKTRVSYFPGMDMRLFSLYMCNKAAPKSAPKVAPEAESAPESGQNGCNGLPARRSRMPSRFGAARTRMDRD